MPYLERIFNRPKTKDRVPRKNQIISEDISELGGGSIVERRPDQERVERQLCAGFDAILAKLRKDPDELKARIEKLKSLPDYGGILGKLEHYFTEEHWEMAAVLEEYDTATFNHSLRVAAFVYDLTNDKETNTYLKEHIGIEAGSLEELFTAALFHDIGKTAIPHDILHDNHSRREWGKHANDWAVKTGQGLYFDHESLEKLDEVELDEYFIQMHTVKDSDPLDIVPIEEFFKPEILRELEQHGISPQDTFRRVLECHEQATRAILRQRKMYVASDIASHHHDYGRRPIRSERYPTETSAVRIGFELSILRAIDVYDALTANDRSYKNPYHPLLALEILIKEAEAEFTEKELTRYVVRDLYKKLTASGKDIPTNDEESQAFEKILAFIGK